MTRMSAVSVFLESLWLVHINPTVDPPSYTNGTWVLFGGSDAGKVYPFGNTNFTVIYNSAGLTNDNISWDVGLSAGTWTCTVFARGGATTGIIHVRIDGVDKGTIDTYLAAAGPVSGSVTGIVMAAGKHTLNLRADTKNGSSGGFLVEPIWITLSRTA